MIGLMVYWGYLEDEVWALGKKMLKGKWENVVGFAGWLVKWDEKERYAKMARFWLWMMEEYMTGEVPRVKVMCQCGGSFES